MIEEKKPVTLEDLDDLDKEAPLPTPPTGEATVTLSMQQFNILLARGGTSAPAAMPSMSDVDLYAARFPGERADAERERERMGHEGRGLPQGFVVLRHRSGTGVIAKWIQGRPGRRVTGPELAPWLLDASVRAFQPHPDSIIAIYRRIVGKLSAPERAAVLDLAREQLGLGSYLHTTHYGVSFQRVTRLYDSLLGKRAEGAQAIYTELTRPVLADLAGQVIDDRLKAKFDFWHELEDGEPLPDAFLRLMAFTGADSPAPAPTVHVAQAMDSPRGFGSENVSDSRAPSRSYP